jgi:radical SAM superfamily enzyme YgiQ (UPF0313 family)
MRVLLVSTYDLGRQPLGLASPAASLRAAGVEVECVDTSRDRLGDDQLLRASVIAFYLPMHTATRLAAPLLERARIVNPHARLAAYGLYAPLNAGWLRERGVSHVLGPDAEDALVGVAISATAGTDATAADGARPPRVTLLQPDRTTLPPLARYAALQMPDGSRRVVGNADATRGCKHLCRHCPIVPVYQGRFRAVPLDLVMADVRAQVAAGAEHITFGDPDFFNGPTHASRLIEQLAAEFPGLTYDATIKIEHLLAHADLLPQLQRTGCLFVTSAVESVDDEVLAKLRKGHTRADFIRAAALCRDAGVMLVPTFVAFTPWTTAAGYLDLLRQIASLDLVEHVAPIQFAIRLLVTADSALLDLPEIRDAVDAYDPQSLTWPWRHHDSGIDALQREVTALVASYSSPTAANAAGETARGSRPAVFDAIHDAACRAAKVQATIITDARPVGRRTPPPYLTEGWYCCAEPGPEQMELV